MYLGDLLKRTDIIYHCCCCCYYFCITNGFLLWARDVSSVLQIIFSIRHSVQTGSVAHTSSYSLCTWGISLGIKRPGLEADHSPPSNVEVKNVWSYTSTPYTSS